MTPESWSSYLDAMATTLTRQRLSLEADEPDAVVDATPFQTALIRCRLSSNLLPS